MVKLSTANNFLLAAIMIVSGYVIITPFIPDLKYVASDHTGRQRQLEQAVAKVTQPPDSNQVHPNSLIVPSMLLDQPVYEGSVAEQYKTLERGIWRWPRSSTPDKGGNTVLLGHRFTYTKPQGVFYFLNKVQPGDNIGLWWNNQKYTYKVSEIREVLPNETSIQDNTADNRLTLFTCTPLWLPKHRLVVTAKLMESS